MNVLAKIYGSFRRLNGIEPIIVDIERDKYIYVLDYKNSNKVLYLVDDTREAVEVLCSMYRSQLYNPNSRDMLSILRTAKMHGFSVEDVANIYGECMRISNGDITARSNRGYKIAELKIE